MFGCVWSRLAMFGMADYKLPEELATLSAEKDASYKFIFMHPNGAHLAEIKTMIEDEKIRPIVDTIYPFAESIDAFTHLATGRAKGKIVIKIN